MRNEPPLEILIRKQRAVPEVERATELGYPQFPARQVQVALSMERLRSNAAAAGVCVPTGSSEVLVILPSPLKATALWGISKLILLLVPSGLWDWTTSQPSVKSNAPLHNVALAATAVAELASTDQEDASHEMNFVIVLRCTASFFAR